MKQSISRIDSRGRVYVSKALRSAADLDQADFVKLGYQNGAVTVQKVLLVEQGDASPEARAQITRANIRMMDKDEIRALAKYILDLEDSK